MPRQSCVFCGRRGLNLCDAEFLGGDYAKIGRKDTTVGITMPRSTMQARVSLAAAAFLVLASILPSLAHAQDYPSHPIKLVLPQPPGGIIDLISRSLGERLSEQMKQPVIVENMPGANGSLAAGQVVRSVPDGYTLFMAVDTNLVVNPNLYTNLAYDPFRDFAPISVLAKCRSCSLRIPRCRPTTCAS